MVTETRYALKLTDDELPQLLAEAQAIARGDSSALPAVQHVVAMQMYADLQERIIDSAQYEAIRVFRGRKKSNVSHNNY